jgi:hypothetical protein
LRHEFRNKGDFYAWRRRIKKRQAVRQGFLELSPSVISSSDTGIRIVFGNLCIEVQRHFDPATLRTVVACLSR